MNVVETKVRLPGDTKARITALVGPNRMASFIREAVEDALKWREAMAKDATPRDEP